MVLWMVLVALEVKHVCIFCFFGGQRNGFGSGLKCFFQGN